jgi:hypothetical protein
LRSPIAIGSVVEVSARGRLDEGALEEPMAAAKADNPDRGESPTAPTITATRGGVVIGVDFLPDHVVAVKITRPGEDVSDYLTYTTDRNGHLYAELPTAVAGTLCIAVTDNRPDPDGECSRLWSNTFSVGVS